MFPILILREETVCLIILIFLAFVSRSFRMGKDGRVFNRLLTLAVIHVTMDFYTVWTVNHRETVLPWVNDAAHIIFFLSAVLYSCEFMFYVLALCGRTESARTFRIPGLISVGLYLILLLAGVLPIQYGDFEGTDASFGPAAVVGYALAFLYFIISIILLLLHRKKLSRHILWSLLPLLVLLVAAEFSQVLVREFLFTGGALTIVTVGLFFSLENPSSVLERKVMLDALNGMGSRSSYERDMSVYDEMFRKNPETPFTFLFVDIINLRSVNGLYGHHTGDEYISSIAVLLMKQLKGAEHIYRMGGDEFLAVYRSADEATVLKDISGLNAAARKECEKLPYEPELAMGYAVSNANYQTLRDVLRVADYMMFRNKADLKRDLTLERSQKGGARLNLSGLTDRVFDAMCLTSEEFYPFMTNMETDVTRLSPGMVEYFGLEAEFVSDFTSVWLTRIHPDDVQSFLDDVTAALQGKKQYHLCRYRALAKNGVYVCVTCRGGVYHGRDGEPDIFSGYLINHGAPELIDPVTGLQNSDAMTDRLNRLLRENESAIILRLEIQNINRIKMLYGLEVSVQVQHGVGDLLQELCRGKGEAFSPAAGSYVLVLNRGSAQAAEELYSLIRKNCSAGITAESLAIPVGLLGSAVSLPHEKLKDHEAIRSASMFALEEARVLQGDRLHFFSPGAVSIPGTANMDIVTKVHRDAFSAMEHFLLRYQPILDLESGKVVGAEALLRWNSPEFGEISPSRFISFLENDPAYTVLGYEIIRHAIRQAGRIRQALPEFRISVNITAIQLLSEEFIPRVCQILQEEGFPADHLILELTERCKELDFPFLTQRVQQLHDAGIRVALDDMGTGFSTIDLLLHLPVDEVKLDFAFTNELQRNQRDALYARVLCEAAASWSVDVCFEGVETVETEEYLRAYGSLLVQGFLYSRPLLPEEFEARYCPPGKESAG